MAQKPIQPSKKSSKKHAKKPKSSKAVSKKTTSADKPKIQSASAPLTTVRPKPQPMVTEPDGIIEQPEITPPQTSPIDDTPVTPLVSKSDSLENAIVQVPEPLEHAIAPIYGTTETDESMYLPEEPMEIISETPQEPITDDSIVETRETEIATPVVTPAKKSHKKKLIVGLILAVIICIVAAVLYLRPSDTQEQVERDLITEVSSRVLVPTNEKPSISTIVDTNKIDQAFLKEAKAGDKILLYFQANKAIVYRPATQQIINIGPLSEPSPRVFIRNGATKSVPTSIQAAIESSGQYVVSSRDVSPKKNYRKTIVVDVAGNRPDVATNVARLLGANVAQLPAGESRPDADILVIVGSEAR